MIILGLLLMAASAAAVAGVVVSSTDVVPVQVFGHSAGDHQIGVVFIAGAVVGLVFAIGLKMLSAGLTRAGRRRGETRAVERHRLAEERALRRRNEELESQLAAGRTEPAAETTAPTAETTPSTNYQHYADRPSG